MRRGSSRGSSLARLFGSRSLKSRYLFYPYNRFSPLRHTKALICWDPVPTSLRLRKGSDSLRNNNSIEGRRWQDASASESLRTFVFMAYVAFLDPPPRSRRALNTFAPRCFVKARKRPRLWSRRYKADSLTLVDNGFYLRKHNWCYLGMISKPCRVQATFNATVPSQSYRKAYFRRRSSMGVSCTDSIDLPHEGGAQPRGLGMSRPHGAGEGSVRWGSTAVPGGAAVRRGRSAKASGLGRKAWGRGS